LRKSKGFLNSPEGSQILFLIAHESTGYKLSHNIFDLTQAQIHTHYLIAKKQSDAVDAALNNNSTTANPLKIVGNESPDVIKEKLSIMKDHMRGR